MRKSFIGVLLLMLVMSQVARADTIHLKNGSVLKGKVSSFADDQFVIMLDTGSGRYLSKAMVYMGDVAKIEFDSAPTAVAESPAQPPPEPVETAPATKTDNQQKGKKGSTAGGETPVRTSQPSENQTKETGPPETSTAPPPPDPPVEKPVASSSSSTTVPVSTEPTETGERSTRKPLVPIKTMNVDVGAKKDWTSSGLIVKRGDHIRITASGSITLDPVSGRTSGPEGVDITDPKKLMPDQPTGALIGVISSDNDDFIFIGRLGEFTATRDGLLFLSVNEGQLSDNLGSFKATVEVLSQRK